MAYSGDDIRRAVDAKRRAYAQEWAATADEHRAAGDYDWMAQFITGHQRVLELGVGDGTATALLASRSHQVMGLDLNPFCLELAENTLTRAGIPFIRQRRVVEFKTYPNGYAIEYGEIDPPPTNVPPVLLLESDTLEDKPLSDWLSKAGPFDALTLWCVGAHGYRSGFTLDEARRFRVNTRGTAYLMADRLLRSGGVMHYIERMPALHDYETHFVSLRSDIPPSLDGTALSLTDLQVRETKTVKAASGVNVSNVPAPGQKPGMYALISTVLTKAQL